MAKRTKLKLIAYTIKSTLILSFSPFVMADTNSDTDTIVVTASGFEQQLKNAPATISVITKEQLEDKQVNDLAEALENVEGVDVRASTGKTGGMDISIRGMPSEYTLVLIDGRRQNESSDITPNGFGSMQTNFIPPISAIERIEVIKGPMSTLYGSDAMGGVINIITKKVSNEWSGSAKFDYTLMKDNKAGDKRNISLYTSGPLIEDKVGLALRGSLYKRDESLRTADDGTVLNKRYNNPVEATIYNLGGRINYSPSNQHDFWLDMETARQTFDNSEAQLGTIGIRGYRDTLHFNRDQIAIGYTGIFDLGTWESSLMYKQTENKGRVITAGLNHAGDNRTLKSENLIFDTKFTATIANVHQFTVGGQWWDSQAEDGIVTNGVNGSKFKQKTYATFVEDEWSITDNLALTGGLRYDHHDTFGSHYSPRAYLVWNTTDTVTLKGGISKGYKAPTLAQLHSGINGVTGQGTIMTIGSPDLKPERSTNFELGMLFDNHNNFNMGVTAFYNKFKDKIAKGDPQYNCNYYTSQGQIAPSNCITVIGAPNSQQEFSQQVNIDKVDIYGLEFGSKYQFLPQLAFNIKYTYTNSKQKSGSNEGKSLTYTPRHMASAKLDWRINQEFSSWFEVLYRGKADRFNSKYENLSAAQKSQYDALGDLRAYTLLNIGGRYKINKQVTLSATIYNLLDKDFTQGKKYTYGTTTEYASYYASNDNSGIGSVLEGRRLWLSANIDF